MRKEGFDHVFQFRVTLNEVRPPVWRRIQVPHTYTFWDLHVAIQDAMGWTDSHLHEFQMRLGAGERELRIGLPDDDDDRIYDYQVLPGWEVPIARLFTLVSRSAAYIYDFGDYWRHSIKLERILPRDSGISYPACIGGKRACPPEDCGGSWGYETFLEAISDPAHERHYEMLEWVGGEFDPAAFVPEEVDFDDPDERWELAFGEGSALEQPDF